MTLPEICICGHPASYHDDPRDGPTSKPCAGCAPCTGFRDQATDADYLRRLIAVHRDRIEGAGKIRTLGRESRERAEAKHAADELLWSVLG